jgi:hypothetical protein
MSKTFVLRVQERLNEYGAGLKADGLAGPATNAALDTYLPSKTVERVVTDSTIPDDYWPMLAKIESGNRPYVKATTSSASGLYQFIKSTWQGEGGKWGPNLSLAFGGFKPSEAEQLQRARTFTEKNVLALRRAGIPVNNASLYAAHFLGAGTAIKALEGHHTDRIDAHVGDAAIGANPSILGGGKTVGDFLTWLHKKTGAWAK